MEFVKNPFGTNEVLEADGFSVSFNAAPWSGFASFEGDTEDGETALVKGGKFFILNGDHRTAYAGLAQLGWDACLAFFMERPELRSSWSSEP